MVVNFLRSLFVPITPKATRKPIQKARLGLERLEDRLTPGAYTVSSTAATGAGTLTAAIAAMDMMHDSSNTITFNSSLSGAIDIPGTISLGLSVTIDGNGSYAPITGNGTFRIFSISGSLTNVTLKNLIITGGSTSDLGGGIYNTATLTVDTCLVYANSAASGGGGIANCP